MQLSFLLLFFLFFIIIIALGYAIGFLVDPALSYFGMVLAFIIAFWRNCLSSINFYKAGLILFLADLEVVADWEVVADLEVELPSDCWHS